MTLNKMSSKQFLSMSAQVTKKNAEKLAQIILSGDPEKRKGAVIVAITGELGAGKTTFVGGFAKKIGIRKRIISPTFVFMRRFSIKRNGFKNFFHIDAYRVQRKNDARRLGMEEVFKNPENLVVVEWASNVKGMLPKNVVSVNIQHGKNNGERFIKIL